MKPTTNNLEGAIEKLAMAITHSEQGFYNKNEKFVREILTDLRKKDMEELIKMLPKYSKHSDYCEFLEDNNMPCDCGVAQYNLALSSCEQLIKDYYEK